jgi:hypothetical protein
VTGDHIIGDAGYVRDLRRDREAGIFEPLPGAEDFVDPPVLTVILEEADAEFDDLVAIRVDAGGPTSTTAATSFGLLSGAWYSVRCFRRLVIR